MTLEIRTEIIINVRAEKIWKILTEFTEYPKWNPFITSIEGKIATGEKIIVKIKPPKSKAMLFKPNIVSVTTNKELSWLGHILFPGIFDGNHKFELIEDNNGTTTFIQSEIFTGFLVGFFKGQLKNNTKNGFIAMNKKLKELAEKV